MRLHWRDVDLAIHLLLLITENATEPVSPRILQQAGSLNFDIGGEVKNDAHSEFECLRSRA